jgi:uncharacterized protein with HEPN domain
MRGKANRDRLRVIAMIQAAEEAKSDSEVGREVFLNGGLNQKAILLDLIHFTESAEKTSAGFKKANPNIPWGRLSGLRNRGLVHDYTDIDLEDIWDFVRREVPRIRRQLDRVSYPAEFDD